MPYMQYNVSSYEYSSCVDNSEESSSPLPPLVTMTRPRKRFFTVCNHGTLALLIAEILSLVLSH